MRRSRRRSRTWSSRPSTCSGGTRRCSRASCACVCCAGCSSALATGLLVYCLGGQLALAERWRVTAVYLALSSQVFYAATAHVGNDWLGVPLFTLLIVCAIAVYEHPTTARAALFAAVLAAGLLTKAYFLAARPLRRRTGARALCAAEIAVAPLSPGLGRSTGDRGRVVRPQSPRNPQSERRPAYTEGRRDFPNRADGAADALGSHSSGRCDQPASGSAIVRRLCSMPSPWRSCWRC